MRWCLRSYERNRIKPPLRSGILAVESDLSFYLRTRNISIIITFADNEPATAGRVVWSRGKLSCDKWLG
jgi:hypothetical protein